MYQEYLDAGFERYKLDLGHEAAECLLQKNVNDSFYVNVHPYDLSKLTNGAIHGVKFQSECQFTDRNGNTFNIELMDVKSPEHAIDFMANAFVSMNCATHD